MEKLERKIMSVILVIVVILALFLGLIDFISDFMWFKEMGYTAVSVSYTHLDVYKRQIYSRKKQRNWNETTRIRFSARSFMKKRN